MIPICPKEWKAVTCDAHTVGATKICSEPSSFSVFQCCDIITNYIMLPECLIPISSHCPRQSLAWQSWETTFSMDHLKLETGLYFTGRAVFTPKPRQRTLGHSQSPWHCLCSQGGCPPRILRHCYWALQDFNMYLRFTVIHFVVLITRKKLVYPKATGFWSAFIKAFYPVIFEKLNYWTYTVCESFINSHFYLILCNFNSWHWA